MEARNAAFALGKTLDSAVLAPEDGADSATPQGSEAIASTAVLGPEHGESSATPQGSEVVASTQDGVPTQVQAATDTATSPRGKGTKQSVKHNKASDNPEAQGHLTTPQENQTGPAKKIKIKAARIEKPGTRASPNSVTRKTTSQPGIRIYTSQNRMWFAITGHGPDESRVKSLDFICLSVIAASGPKGILQHNLVSITGQDKRSVPSRTDRLRDDGYIVKVPETTWVGEPPRRLHTSRCTLTRCLKDNIVAEEKADANIAVDPPVRKRKRKAKRVTGVTKNKAPIAQSEPPPVPQWTIDRTVGNQVFELVRRSGTRGMSASVSKRRVPEDGCRSICSFCT